MPSLCLPAWQQVRIVFFSSIFLLIAACGEKPQQGPGDMKVPVSVVTVDPSRAEIFVELPGRVEAIKDAQIRARVTGIVTAINFKQGSDVKDGQALFTIDPAPYQAVRAQAAAQLQKAQADARALQSLARRYAKLIKVNAISQQEYDNAVAQAAQAEAAIAAAQASLLSADIDLGYTHVVSPIDGRIGKSLVTEGALVSAAEATQMATVQQLDRVYVDLTRSTIELAQLRRALASGVLKQTEDGSARVEVLLEDGSVYDQTGKLLFSGVTVDPTTGQVNLRAEFPNPDQILLPGMYVRVRLQQGIDDKALLVPAQAVQRTANGLDGLMLVQDGKVEAVVVTLGPLINGRYLVYKGLKPGDVVIVEGFQKIRPGAPVQPMPWKGKPAAGGAAAPAPGAPADKAASSDPTASGEPAAKATPTTPNSKG